MFVDKVPFQQSKFLKFAPIEFPYIEVEYDLEIRGSDKQESLLYLGLHMVKYDIMDHMDDMILVYSI